MEKKGHCLIRNLKFVLERDNNISFEQRCLRLNCSATKMKKIAKSKRSKIIKQTDRNTFGRLNQLGPILCPSISQ